MDRKQRKALAAALGVGAAATAGLAALNAGIKQQTPPLWPALEGEHGTYDWDAGEVFYTVAGRGHSVLLLHSHNAAASSYEVRRAFEVLSRDFRVFAPDLPGYGMSERRERPYFADTYIRFILEFARDVIGEPAVLIGTSVSAAQALIAAYEDPEPFSHVVAVAPTGLSQRMLEPPAALRPLGLAVGLPVWGEALFNAIVSRGYIRKYLEDQVYFDPWNVTHEMVDYAWTSAHQENARPAPAAFLSGALWADARIAYAQAPRPTLVVWGEHDTLNPYTDAAPLLSANPDARVSVITNAAAAPYDEQPAEFAKVVRNFLADSGAPEAHHTL